MPQLAEVTLPEEVDVIRSLFTEYKQSVGVDLWFGRDFDLELSGLPDPYVRPGGRLLLVRKGGEVAGCGALRRVDARVAEMKRMWLRPRYRGMGIGRVLARTLIEAASEEGYSAVRLETLTIMPRARDLYRSMGFVDIPHTSAQPFPGSTVMQRLL